MSRLPSPCGVMLSVLLLATACTSSAGDGLEGHAGDWSVEITTLGRKSGEPRTTTIWFVTEDGVVWVQSGKGGRTDWYRNLVANPEVSLRFGDFRLRGRAERIADPKEAARVHALFLSKYWTARIASWFGREFGQGEVVRIVRDP